MARAQYFVGLDIGSTLIRVVACEKKDSPGLAIVGVGEAHAEGLRKGAVVSPEVTARSIQKAFHDLKSPVQRITWVESPCPVSKVLEDYFYPNTQTILQAVYKVFKKERLLKNQILEEVDSFKGPY